MGSRLYLRLAGLVKLKLGFDFYQLFYSKFAVKDIETVA